MAVRPTTVQLDEARYLFYRSEDMEAFEDMLGGQSWQKAVQEQGEKRLKLLLWAGMRHRNKTQTVAQVSTILDKARANEVELVDFWRGVLEALQNSGFLPPATGETGLPTMMDEARPAPSPGDTPGSGPGPRRRSGLPAESAP